jgi:DNA mismatch endonuclease (patch repair protein)
MVETTPERSAMMARIRSVDTKPEMLVRRALHRLGFRFRLHVRGLPGRPDIVLPKYRTVIQVKGCFWHGHTCRDGRLPKSNRDYWVPKLLQNRRRDRTNERKLRVLGWSVRNLWECRICGLSRVGLDRRLTRMFQGNSSSRRYAGIRSKLGKRSRVLRYQRTWI